MNEQMKRALNTIVGMARARSIDTSDRVRNYNSLFLGGHNTDHDEIQKQLESLTEKEKHELWEYLSKDILEQSNWKVYELRFLMRLFGVEHITVYASRNFSPPKYPTFDDIDETGADLVEQEIHNEQKKK